MKILELLNNEDIVKYSIRIEKGENIMELLTNFAKDYKVGFGEINAVGAFVNTKYGIFEHGDYERFVEKELAELISFNGNISWKEDEPLVHAHVMMSLLENGELKCIGGHLFEAEVGVTAEIFVTSFKKHKVERHLDTKCGLFVLDLDKTLKG